LPPPPGLCCEKAGIVHNAQAATAENAVNRRLIRVQLM
jgi:hypothetical protein